MISHHQLRTVIDLTGDHPTLNKRPCRVGQRTDIIRMSDTILFIHEFKFSDSLILLSKQTAQICSDRKRPEIHHRLHGIANKSHHRHIDRHNQQHKPLYIRSEQTPHTAIIYQ